jgi:hypothetical protein
MCKPIYFICDDHKPLGSCVEILFFVYFQFPYGKEYSVSLCIICKLRFFFKALFLICVS